MHNNAKQMFGKRYVLILTDKCFCIFILFCHIRELNLLRALSWMAGGFDWLGKAYCLHHMLNLIVYVCFLFRLSTWNVDCQPAGSYRNWAVCLPHTHTHTLKGSVFKNMRFMHLHQLSPHYPQRDRGLQSNWSVAMHTTHYCPGEHWVVSLSQQWL